MQNDMDGYKQQSKSLYSDITTYKELIEKERNANQLQLQTIEQLTSQLNVLLLLDLQKQASSA
jgi:hypothetical protein